MNDKVFCRKDVLGAIDLAVDNGYGVLVGQISGETIEQLEVRYPGVIVDTMENVIARQEAAMKSAPVMISEERFEEMLSCLPPEDWRSRGESESFKCSEHTSGNITGIYARIGKYYFHLSDTCTLKHDEIISRIQAQFPTLESNARDPRYSAFIKAFVSAQSDIARQYPGVLDNPVFLAQIRDSVFDGFPLHGNSLIDREWVHDAIEWRLSKLQDGEVLGVELDGVLIQWNTNDRNVYCSENLDEFGSENLTDVERARIGLIQAEQPAP